MAAGPRVPVDDEPWWRGSEGEGGEQTLDLGDGQRDHAGLVRWLLVRADRGRGLGAGAVPEQGGGDGADRQRGHDQHQVAGDRAVQACLALVEAEAVLAKFEIFFYWPSQSCGTDQPHLG